MKFSDSTSSIVTNIDALTSSTMSAYKEGLIEIQDLNSEMTITESVFALTYSTVGSSAFLACKNLTTASFPNVTTIGNYAFERCKSLTAVSFPNATSIGMFAFYSCTSLTAASFPNATTIVTFAF